MHNSNIELTYYNIRTYICMFVCVCVYVYVCMCVIVYVCTFVSVCAWMYVCIIGITNAHFNKIMSCIINIHTHTYCRHKV